MLGLNDGDRLSDGEIDGLSEGDNEGDADEAFGLKSGIVRIIPRIKPFK